MSKVESLTRVWRRETERARQADFRLAHRFVSEHDAVIVEDLAVGNMLRSRLWSRKMSEQRWASFDAVLEYKAWKAGIRFEKVNPSNTKHRLLNMRTPAEDAAVSKNVRVWQLRAGPRQGPQRSPQHMRPRRLPPTERRRAGDTGGT